MLETTKRGIADAVKTLFDLECEPIVSVPEEHFGDVSSNVAMQITKQVGLPPREIAEKIVAELKKHEAIADASVAGPGFINVRLNDSILLDSTQASPKALFAGQTIVCEYSDMNAFKTAHVGHLYTTLVGNAIANLCEAAGARVIRANFGGDVGLHVGKAMWGIMRATSGDLAQLEAIPETERAAWIAARYVEGNEAYETDEVAKAEITDLNKQVYRLHEAHDHDSELAHIYWMCRQWSYDGFELFYDSLQITKQPDGTYFTYYPESETAPFGADMVRHGKEQGVFVESDGALVYEGEKDGLHTRVFLTAQGLPTYETKDLGLAIKKWQDYEFDRSIIITAHDISEYMKVIVAVLRHFQPEIADRTTHITHGLVKLAGGQKMSSRKGNVLLPEDVIAASVEAQQVANGKVDMSAVLGAVKYSFLKNRIGGDMIYDPTESVAIEGNSGPYLQYAHARARSILSKSEKLANPPSVKGLAFNRDGKSQFSEMSLFEQGERTLVRALAQYNDVIQVATAELAPHHICSYLYELAQEFNRFYENNQVIGSERESERLWLVEQYANTLKKGLSLLSIHAPEQM